MHLLQLHDLLLDKQTRYRAKWREFSLIAKIWPKQSRSFDALRVYNTVVILGTQLHCWVTAGCCYKNPCSRSSAFPNPWRCSPTYSSFLSMSGMLRAAALEVCIFKICVIFKFKMNNNEVISAGNSDYTLLQDPVFSMDISPPVGWTYFPPPVSFGFFYQ